MKYHFPRRQPENGDPADKPRMFKAGFAAGVTAVASVILAAVYLGSGIVERRVTGIEEARVLGTPVRAGLADASAVFLMTAQKEIRTVPGSRRWQPYRKIETVTHFDLWRFDGRTAQPAWRKRLLTTSESVNFMDAGVAGADGDRLWVFLREPLLVSAATGDVIHGATEIEARNPPLQGVLPRKRNHYVFFDGHGLVFTAADARAWRLDAQTLKASPWEPNKAVRRAEAVGPPYYAASSVTGFQQRGLLLERDWLGVLTDAEAAALNGPVKVPGAKPGERRGAMAKFLEYNRAPPRLEHAGPKRYRLWRAKVEQVSAAPEDWPKHFPDNWGKRPRYGSFTVFEKSPEFLQAGLLGDGRSRLPVLLTNPDSVLVLHRDRIDDKGVVHLTRIAGPDGHTLWNAALPLSLVQAVIPTGGRLLLFGRQYVQKQNEVGDPYHGAHEWLVSLDTASGAVQAFDITAVDIAHRPRNAM